LVPASRKQAGDPVQAFLPVSAPRRITLVTAFPFPRKYLLWMEAPALLLVGFMSIRDFIPLTLVQDGYALQFTHFYCSGKSASGAAFSDMRIGVNT
jgi:hypothetical protein